MTLRNKRIGVNNLAVAVAATLTTILEKNVSSIDRIGIEVEETAGSYALDQFVINARFNDGGNYQTVFSTSGDYTSPAGILVGTSGDLTAIPASSAGWLILDCRGIESIQIRAASSNAAGSTVDVNGGE